MLQLCANTSLKRLKHNTTRRINNHNSFAQHDLAKSRNQEINAEMAKLKILQDGLRAERKAIKGGQVSPRIAYPVGPSAQWPELLPCNIPNSTTASTSSSLLTSNNSAYYRDLSLPSSSSSTSSPFSLSTSPFTYGPDDFVQYS